MTHNKLSRKLPLISKGDIIIIISLLALAALLFVLSLATGGSDGAQAVVSVNGRTEAVLPLDKDAEYIVSSEGHVNVICVENGVVFMRSADCPDGYCIEQGAISKTGEMIVCLPNRVTVTIDGSEEQLDAVAY